MFDETPDLSPDLEWMLGSRQASDQALIRALLKECYSDVFRLSTAMLIDTEAVRRTIVESFANAILKVEDFRGQEGIRVWLLRIAIDPSRAQNAILKARAALQVPRLEQRQIQKNGHKIYQDDFQGELWQAVDVLPEQDRLPLILHSVLDLPTWQVSQILGTGLQHVEKQIENARRQIQDLLGRGNLLESVLRGESLESYMDRSLKGRWPAMDPEIGEIENLIAEIEIRIRMKRQERLRTTRLKELLLLFAAILVVAGVLRAAIVLSQDDTVAPPLNPSRRVTPTPIPAAGMTATAVAVLPSPTIVPPSVSTLSEPLRTSSDSRVIQLRMSSDPSWNTLWADVSTIFYGPVGYVGAPRTYRDQLWIARGEQQAIVLTGMNSGTPELSLYYDPLTSPTENNPYGFSFYEVERLGLPFPWASLHLDDYPFGARINELIWLYDSRFLGELPNWRVTGVERVAGREALVLEQSDMSGSWLERFWIDTTYALLLREQLIKDGIVVLESVVTGVTFDGALPKQVFTDWRDRPPDYYSFNFQGDPEMVNKSEEALSKLQPPLARRAGYNAHPDWLAPEALDLARSRLTFQSVPDLGTGQTPSNQVEIFAGNFYLGSLEIGDPFKIACTRSPDGATIAYADYLFPGFERPDGWQSSLHWVRLDELDSIQTVFDQTNIFSFGFSPDSQRLVVTGVLPDEEKSFVNLVSLESGENVEIWSGDSTAGELVTRAFWMPEGNTLALLLNLPIRTEVVLLDPETGHEIRRLQVNSSDYQPTARFEIDTDWTIDLDSYRIWSLQDCAEAPAPGN